MTTTTTTTTPPRVAGWVRAGAVLLAIPQLVTGLWAVLDTRGWYDEFPGFGPMLVAAEPPYNPHLASDAGAGFIATGVVLVLAALWGDRRPMQLAFGGLLAFALAHLAYHAPNPSPLLSDSQNTVNVIVLVLAAAIPLALLLATTLSRKDAR